MKRRDFLSVAALGAGALAVHSTGTSLPAESNPPKNPKSTDPVASVLLYGDIKCSRIGFGTGMRGGDRVSDMVRAGWEKSIDLLQFAYDNGIRLYDCADMYGTHRIVAEAMKGKPRDSYTLVSKLWLHPRGGLPEKERLTPEETVPRLLREFKTDHIDVLQLHCMSSQRWSAEFEDAMAGMDKLKEKGIIRAHGISSHSNAATELAAQTPWCDVIHVRINSEGMNMDGPNDVQAKIDETLRTARMAHQAGKGIIAMKLLGEGKMANQPELRKKSTGFVVNLDCVDAVIASFAERAHITEFIENVAAALS